MKATGRLVCLVNHKGENSKLHVLVPTDPNVLRAPPFKTIVPTFVTYSLKE